MNQWRNYDHDDKSTWPTETGVYRVMISGDSESCDGYTIYEYPDYATWAEAIADEDDEGNPCIVFGQGTHDEEPEGFFAYFGPIPIPEFKEPAACPGPTAQETKTEN
jgi:hypothetical protein